MPRHTTIATAIDKHKIASSVAYLIMLEVNVVDPESGSLIEVVRLAANNENYVWQGNTYAASVFEADVSFEQDKVPSVTITFRDFLNVIQPRMQAYGGMMGSSIRMIVINASVPNNPPEMDEIFTVIAGKANASDYTITFQIGAENPLGLRFPPRLAYRDRCMFQYKGLECGYTGSLPSCDFTLNGPNGCKAHNNSPRFGGFPGLRPTS